MKREKKNTSECNATIKKVKMKKKRRKMNETNEQNQKHFKLLQLDTGKANEFTQS